jgi:hypothetical protein
MPAFDSDFDEPRTKTLILTKRRAHKYDDDGKRPSSDSPLTLMRHMSSLGLRRTLETSWSVAAYIDIGWCEKLTRN